MSPQAHIIDSAHAYISLEQPATFHMSTSLPLLRRCAHHAESCNAVIPGKASEGRAGGMLRAARLVLASSRAHGCTPAACTCWLGHRFYKNNQTTSGAHAQPPGFGGLDRSWEACSRRTVGPAACAHLSQAMTQKCKPGQPLGALLPGLLPRPRPQTVQLTAAAGHGPKRSPSGSAPSQSGRRWHQAASARRCARRALAAPVPRPYPSLTSLAPGGEREAFGAAGQHRMLHRAGQEQHQAAAQRRHVHHRLRTHLQALHAASRLRRALPAAADWAQHVE